MAVDGRANGLRWRLQAMRRLWSPGARPEMNFLPPLPVAESIEGEVDCPGAGVEIDEERIDVNGWVAFEDGPTARVEAWLDDVPLGRARVGLPRPDLVGVKHLPNVAYAGFELGADLSVLADSDRFGPRTVKVVATAVSGRRHEFEPILLKIDPPAATAVSETIPTPAVAPPRDGVLRVLVITHQLTLGGAQLYLLDLLHGLRTEAEGKIEFTVVSSMDGPLRDELDEMGIPVHLTSASAGDDAAAHRGRVEELAAWLAPHRFDVALVNTATTAAFTGAEAAGRLGIPAVWAIHESFPPALLWAELEPELRAQAEEAVGAAAFAVFEADATRRIFEPLVDPERCRTLPYGVDFSTIERAREGFDRAAERRRSGLPEDADVLVCIGTVEPRKAQLPLAQAFELIAARHPRARLVFVGGRRKDQHTIVLAEFIEASSVGDRIELIPITPDVQRWYGLADVLVCASDIESLPRTVLEAMAWETPVLATSVFGLPELIDDGETGWLCEPRDISRLAAALDDVLGQPPEARDRIAANARALVEQRHSLPNYAEEMSRLLREAAGASSKREPRRTTSG